MDINDAEHQYVSGQYRDSFPEIFAAFEAANTEALSSRPWRIDVPYGPLQRQTFDFCAARGRAVGTVLYFHAGFWQSRDKSQFRFLARTLSDAGFNAAMVNYPLCPDVSLTELSLGVRQALPAVISSLPSDQAGLPVIASGHSAGGHLAVELALAQADATPTENRIRGIVAISGIYDLEPLVETTLNVRLKLDPRQARANSPLRRARPGMPAAVFLVGGEETPAFVMQSDAMSRAWSEAGNVSECIAIEGKHHFSVLQTLQRADGPLVEAIYKVVGLSGNA